MPFSVGALTSPAVETVTLEWMISGEMTRLTVKQQGTVGENREWRQPRGAGGNLAAAATRTRHRGVVWAVQPPPLRYAATARYRFVAFASNGRSEATRWHMVTPARWQSGRGQLKLHAAARICERLVPDSIQWFADRDVTHKIRFALRLDDDEHVVGFGERFDHLDQRGNRLDAVVFEQYKDQAATGRTYLPMPFAHVVGPLAEGWGFHVRTARRVWFDVGARDPHLLWVEAETGGLAEPTVELDLYTGSPAEVLSAFLDEAGRPEIPPDWVYRLWISGNEWNTQQLVMTQANRHRDERIPFGVVVIEAWSDESTFCFFRDSRYPLHDDGAPHTLSDIVFPADGAWPDPKAMIDELHTRGIKVVLWQIPLQKMRPHPTGQAAADAARMLRDGYCVSEADGRPYRNRGWWFPLALMPDFTNPESRSWWASKRRYLVEQLDVDGFKTDGGEHAWGHDLRYHDGTRGDETNNRFPVLYAGTYHDLIRECGKQPVTFSRAGHTGAQRLPCHWAGDENSSWQAFRHSVTAGITAGASGIIHWGWDLAGFSGEIPDAELYIRATQAACFMPIMQYHSEFNHHRQPSRDRTPWNIAERTGVDVVLDVFRRYAHLRELLVPYLAEQAARGLVEGKPLMRAMFFEASNDPAIWAYPQQYFLGDDLIVSPVTQPGVTVWPVYLPKGEWIDLFSGFTQPAGDFQYSLSIDLIPIFVRRRAWPILQQLHEFLASAVNN